MIRTLCSQESLFLQFMPTPDEVVVIRSLLDAQESLVVDTDFIIEENPFGMCID